MPAHRLLHRLCAPLAAAGLIGLLAAGAPARAAYPEQPIKLVVGFPPGGGGDLYGRAIATALGKQLGKTVFVDNKAGAGGNIAAEAVANAKPDGYTLILAMSGNMASAVAIQPKLAYKVPDDFAPIAQLVETPYGLMVSGKSKIANIQQYVQAAKGGKLTYASTGTGGASQVVMEMIKQQAALDILHIPYKGSGPALTDLYGGQVDSFFAPYTPLMGQISAGKLRLLAVTTDKRLAALSDVPTLKESGIDVVMTQWYGLAAPKGTPKDVIETLVRAVQASMQDAELLKVYRADGAQESHRTGQAFGDFIVKDIANYRRAVERGNLKAE
ncbi:MAG: tripartite tricarboxylate transporter substrate binding protein [Burkholderiales bacterium]|nr:tripartite tricarboxylate transporter substrate binding protein [Burkholderiales bacterium]